MGTAIGIIAAVIVVTATMLVYGRLSWTRYSQHLVNRLTQYEPHDGPGVVRLGELPELPPPVQRYFRLTLSDGLPIINVARITQRGGFRTKPDQTTWYDFRARQVFAVPHRGFVWDATIHTGRLIKINVVDSLIAADARMKGKVLSTVTVLDAQGRRELDEAALQRYLAEAVWFPTALLPGQGVQWSPVNDSRATATIRESGLTASLEFEFNDHGEIIEVYTDGRYREMSGDYQLCPWRGRFSSYIEIDGYRIPSEGQAAWILGGDVFTYWRAKISSVSYA